MNTLQEFLVYTKGWEYLITFLSVVLFALFWGLLSKESPPKGKKQPK